jgi:hypothetical protein
MKTCQIVLTIIAVINIGCSSFEVKQLNESMSNKQTEVKSGTNNEDCLDVKMEKWYTAFHAFQGKGLDMLEADKRAVEASNEEFLACQRKVVKRGTRK